VNDLVYARLVEQRRAHVPAQTDIIHRAAGSRSRPATRVDRVNPHCRVPLPEVAGAAHQRAGGAGPDELLPVSLQHWAAADVPTAVIIPRRDRVVPPTRQHTLAAAVPDAVTYDLDGDHGVFLTAPGPPASGGAPAEPRHPPRATHHTDGL